MFADAAQQALSCIPDSEACTALWRLADYVCQRVP